MSKICVVYNYNAWNADGGRLQNLTSTQVSTGTALQNQTYNYDSVGNIETIVDSISGPQTQTFTYDELDRLLSSSVTGGTDGLYSEAYTYNPNNGNLKTKGSATYTYNAGTHAVASLSNGNSYGYDQNGNMTSRHVFEGTEFKDYTLAYNAENQLVSVSGDATANFKYDADGKQVKATVNGITAVYVGNHYEVKNNIVTKYYFVGATRLAVRTDGTLSFLLGDHLGSSSVTTNASGAKTASALYKAFGETRYALGNLNTDYHFTGQREEVSLGIYFFNARWYDGSLGRFLSPDTIVPTSTQGTQAWDRYAFVNNNPVRYTDPTGHIGCSPDERDEGSCEENEGDARLVSLSGSLGAGPLFITGSIDIVTTDNQTGVFYSYGYGPWVAKIIGSTEFDNLNDYDATFMSPQAGFTLWDGIVYGESVDQDVKNYQGSALQAGAGLGPVSIEVFSSANTSPLSPDIKMPDLSVYGGAVGVGPSAQTAEIHINYVNAVYWPAVTNLVCSIFGC